MDGGLIVVICSVVALLVFVIGLTIMNSPVEKDEVTPEPINSEYKPKVRYVAPVKASGSNDYNDTSSDLLTTAIVLSALNNTDDCRHEHNHSHVDTPTPIYAEAPDHGYHSHNSSPSSYDSGHSYDGGSNYDSGGGSDCGSCDCGGGGCD